jgi:hypothetical protein
LPETLAALRRLRASGRQLILITGREMPELLTLFPEIELCDWVVGENGALLYQPSDGTLKILAEPPPADFPLELRRRGVERLSVGHVIVATWEPYEAIVLEVIRDLGLELQVIFNKGAVMVLPTGVNKASGLRAVLQTMGLSRLNVVGIGDAENDHSFLQQCGCAVAVANAIPSLQSEVDSVTAGDHGDGVIQIIDQLLAGDLQELDPVLTRHDIPLGVRSDGETFRISLFGPDVLFLGSPQATVAAAGFLKRLAAAGAQYCAIDPNGNFTTLPESITLGTAQRPPALEEVLPLLADPQKNAVVQLTGLNPSARPLFCSLLLSRLHELRGRTGHPHAILVHAAESLVPDTVGIAPSPLPQDGERLLLVTAGRNARSETAFSAIGVVVALGAAALALLQEFGRTRHQILPTVEDAALAPDEAFVWLPQEKALFRIRLAPSPI